MRLDSFADNNPVHIIGFIVAGVGAALSNWLFTSTQRAA